MDDRATVALVALLSSTKRGWSDVRLELLENDPETLLWQEVGTDLFGGGAEELMHDAEDKMRSWREAGISVLSPYSADYPGQLRSVHDYPPLLFARGVFDTADQDAIAVVGTRHPSAGALRYIDQVVPMLADANLPVVSGLAMGVDAAAMKASLRSANRTIGIIGTGLNRSYPSANADLQRYIAEHHLLLSQFWPDAPPTKQSFPMRNHVMSAFSSMTLIVEASENSGTRIQARAATRHARPLIVTRAVYQETQWAKELVAQRFDVSVVGDASETLEVVRAIRARGAAAENWADAALPLVGG